MFNRREFMRLAMAAGAGSFLPGCVNGRFGMARRKPNILIIVTDDQGYADLSAFSHRAADIHTPNMDRIANEGVLCSQAYVSAPVCSPSRAGWNTGKYQHRWDPSAGWGPGLPDDVKTLAEYLKQAGYATGKIGKNDYGTSFHKMDVREYPLNHGYDEFLGFSAHAHDFFLMSEDIEKRTPDPHGTSAVLGPLFHNRTRKSIEDGYTTEVFTDAAIDFMDRHKDGPFLLTVTYNSLHHLIHEVPDEYLAKHGVAKIANYEPETMGKYDSYYTKYRKIGPINDADMRKYYLANLNCLDDNIGRILDKLSHLGLEDDTLIIYFSDNGGSPMTGADNRPLRGSKYIMFEGGIRVPFIVKWKGQLTAGQKYPYRLSSLDIVPTCLEVCGAQANEQFDGESFWPALQSNSPAPTENRALFWKFKNHWAVRKGDFKLVKTNDEGAAFKKLQITERYLPGPKAPRDRPMLFNLRNDPAEQHDIYLEQPEKAKELEQLFTTWQTEMAHKQ